jgi:hypothetical protein
MVELQRTHKVVRKLGMSIILVFFYIDCHACVPISPNLEFDFAPNRGRETTTIGMCKICDRVSLNEAAKHGKTTSSTSLFKCPTNNHEMP